MMVPDNSELAKRGGIPWRLFTLMAAVFVVSRIAYFLAGVRFDITFFEWGWQCLDPELLTNRLLESCYYLHSQPPLFNLFIIADELNTGLSLSFSP